MITEILFKLAIGFCLLAVIVLLLFGFVWVTTNHPIIFGLSIAAAFLFATAYGLGEWFLGE
jgi:hypothetical protein